MSQTIEGMVESLSNHIGTRIATCEGAGNLVQKKKWEAELKALTLPQYAQALLEIGFDPARLDELAIYSTQKVRRLVACVVGAGRADPYTATVIGNARLGNGGIANRAMLASLSEAVKIDKAAMEGAVRRKASEATASTQASSTRQALLALGAGRLAEKGVFQIDLDHPVVKAVAA